MGPPGFAADGGSNDQCTHNTSGQNADGNMQLPIAVEELAVVLLLVGELLFSLDAALSFRIRVAKLCFGVGSEHKCDEHRAENCFHGM